MKVFDIFMILVHELLSGKQKIIVSISAPPLALDVRLDWEIHSSVS